MSKDGDFISHIDKIDDTEAQSASTIVKHFFINNQILAPNKGKLKDKIYLLNIFLGLSNVYKNY